MSPLPPFSLRALSPQPPPRCHMRFVNGQTVTAAAKNLFPLSTRGIRKSRPEALICCTCSDFLPHPGATKSLTKSVRGNHNRASAHNKTHFLTCIHSSPFTITHTYTTAPESKTLSVTLSGWFESKVSAGWKRVDYPYKGAEFANAIIWLFQHLLALYSFGAHVYVDVSEVGMLVGCSKSWKIHWSCSFYRREHLSVARLF